MPKHGKFSDLLPPLWVHGPANAPWHACLACTSDAGVCREAQSKELSPDYNEEEDAGGPPVVVSIDMDGLGCPAHLATNKRR